MLKPLNDRVLVKSIVEEKSKGGILLPDKAKEAPGEGVVVAVGAGRISESGDRIPVEAEVGETVIFSKYSGVEVEVDKGLKGEAFYFILKEREILARKEDENAAKNT